MTDGYTPAYESDDISEGVVDILGGTTTGVGSMGSVIGYALGGLIALGLVLVVLKKMKQLGKI